MRTSPCATGLSPLSLDFEIFISDVIAADLVVIFVQALVPVPCGC